MSRCICPVLDAVCWLTSGLRSLFRIESLRVGPSIVPVPAGGIAHAAPVQGTGKCVASASLMIAQRMPTLWSQALTARGRWSVGAIAVVVLSYAVRLQLLDAPAISWDEGWSAWLAKQGWWAIAAHTAADEHPPLYYWFLRAWAYVAGDDAFVLRYASLWFAVLAISLSYALASGIGGRRVGFVTAAFLALSPFDVRWSQEIRMYALGILLALLLLWCALRWIDRRRPLPWAAYVLVGFVAVHTHYLLLIPVALLGIGIGLQLLVQRRVAAATAWLAAHVAIGVGFAPWLLYYLSHATVFSASAPLEWGHLLVLAATVLPLGISDTLEQFVLVALLFAALTLVGAATLLISKSPAARWQALILLALITLPLVVVQVASRIPQAPFHPKMAARYFAFSLPFYALLLAQGGGAVWRKNALLGLAFAAFGLTTLGWSLDRYFDRKGQNQKEEVEALGRFVELNYREGDAVLLLGDRNWPVVRFYAGNADRWLYVSDTWRNPSQQQLDGLWSSSSSRPRRVWLVKNERSQLIDPDGRVEAWLMRRLPKARSFTFGSRALSLYGQVMPSLGLAMTHEARDPTGLPFVFDRVPSRWPAGRARYVYSLWSRTEGLLDVRLVLRSPGDEVVWVEPRRHFVGLARNANDDAPLVHVLALPATLPGGLYRLGARIRTAAGESEIGIRRLAIDGVPAPSRTANLQPARVVFGGQVALTGLGIRRRDGEGEQSLEVLLRWRAETPVVQRYKLFLHLVDSEGLIWAQTDQFPMGDDYPMVSWVVGDEVLGGYTLRLPATPLPETLVLLGGLCDAIEGERLPITDSSVKVLSDHRALLAQLPIPARPFVVADGRARKPALLSDWFSSWQ